MQKLSKTIRIKLRPTKKKVDWWETIFYIVGISAITIAVICIFILTYKRYYG